MRIQGKYRATYLANREAFMNALKPVLDDSFGIDSTPPTDPAERAIYDGLMADLNRDRAITRERREREERQFERMRSHAETASTSGTRW